LGYLGFLGGFWGYLATSNAKSNVGFLLGDPDFLLDDEILRLSYLAFEIPILGYLGVWGFWGYLATSGAKSDDRFLLGNPDFLLQRRNFALISLRYRDLPVRNLTLYSCSATLISYKGDKISHLSLLVIEIPIFGYLGFRFSGIFSYFQCKI